MWADFIFYLHLFPILILMFFVFSAYATTENAIKNKKENNIVYNSMTAIPKFLLGLFGIKKSNWNIAIANISIALALVVYSLIITRLN